MAQEAAVLIRQLPEQRRKELRAVMVERYAMIEIGEEVTDFHLLSAEERAAWLVYCRSLGGRGWFGVGVCEIVCR